MTQMTAFEEYENKLELTKEQREQLLDLPTCRFTVRQLIKLIAPVYSIDSNVGMNHINNLYDEIITDPKDYTK